MDRLKQIKITAIIYSLYWLYNYTFDVNSPKCCFQTTAVLGILILCMSIIANQYYAICCFTIG